MQKEMATIELVAQDNHERARRLMKELSQMQHEYLELKKQVFTPKSSWPAWPPCGPVTPLPGAQAGFICCMWELCKVYC